MYGRRSIGLILTVIFAGGGIFFAASKALTTLTKNANQASPERTTGVDDKEAIKYSPSPFNAFLEPIKSYIPNPVYSDGSRTEEQKNLPQILSLPSDISSVGIPGVAIPKPTSSQNLSLLETLPIPQIGLEEIIIDPAGIKNAEEYGTFLARHAKEVKFPEEKMKRILKDDKGITLMPMRIIEKGLKENDFEKIRESLSLLKEFVAARMEFGKLMKVTGDTIEMHQKMLGFDVLTIELLDKASQVATRTLSKQDLESFYQKYKNTASFYNREFYSKYQGLSVKQNPWYAFLDVFGLRKITHAVGPILAGLITKTVACTCDPNGYAFIVGPPFPGPFYITYAQVLSNPLYTVGVIDTVWILGYYSPGAVCMQIATPCVAGPPFPIGIPTLAGTG